MKHFRLRAIRALPLLMVLCALSITFPLRAQAQAITIGVIDEDKLAEGYTKYKDAVAALDTHAQDLDKQLDARELLNDTESKRFDELIIKDKPTDAEKTELDNLIKTGGGRRAEHLGLIGKATRTDDEDARLKALTDQAAANTLGVRSIQDKLYDQIKKSQEAIDDEHTNRANEVIKQVAADKKLVLVWRKRAVIWNAPSVDITDEVLSRLNKA